MPNTKQFRLTDSLATLKLPPCPAVFGLLSNSMDEDADVGKISRTISMDPVLAAEVLRVANSAFYGAPRGVRSVDDAIVRLGFVEITTIALGLKSKDIFKTGGWTPFNTRLWNHSLATASIMCALAHRINPRFRDVFFTVGILHDFGKLILQQGVAGYPEIATVYRGAALTAKEQQMFGANHAEVGAELLQLWNLPPMLVKLTAGHHLPIPPEDPMDNVRKILWTSDEMAHSLEHPTTATIGFSVAPIQAIMSIAGLNDNDWNQALTSCQRQFNALKN